MLQTRQLMNMPITVEVVDSDVGEAVFDEIYDYFDWVENKFSVYKENSEINLINKGEITEDECSSEMKEILRLSSETKRITDGFFDIEYQPGQYDPSGLVKGWSVLQAAQILKNKGYKNYYVEAGGDAQVNGKNKHNQDWQIGIRNPFRLDEVIKVVALSDLGIATSGTYMRGQHIYNPHKKEEPILDIVSLSVIGPDVYEADRFATAAFAMGRAGIDFIEKQKNFEGYMIDKDGIATMTSGFNKFVV